MFPETALVKAVELLPSQIEHQPKGTVVLMPNRAIKPKRGRPRIKPVVTTSVGTVAAPPAGPVENEDQKRVFEYYLALGDKRTIPKVAEYFSIKKETVYQWGRKFGWGRKVRQLASRSSLDIIKSNVLNYLVKTTGEMVIPDPDHHGKTIANPEFTASKAKDTISAYVNVRKSDLETEAHQKEMESGPGRPGVGGRGRGGVMVNVVIQK